MSSDNQHTKKTIKIRWTCEVEACNHINVRIITKGNVLFEDTCEKCNKFTHEPITRVIKEK